MWCGVDTGCGSAIGGKAFHHALHRTMDGLGWTYKKVRQAAYSRFGLGEPIRPETVWMNRVGILGLVKNGRWQKIPHDCHGPVGPDDIASWRMMLDVPGEKSQGEREQNVRVTSGHPCVSLLDFLVFTTNYPLTVAKLYSS